MNIFQVVDEIYDKFAAGRMGIDQKGQVVLMIHCGSRGFGHQVATDALVSMEKAMKRDKIEVNDRQLACARIQSKEGQDYLNGMAAAANFAWVRYFFICFGLNYPDFMCKNLLKMLAEIFFYPFLEFGLRSIHMYMMSLPITCEF